ncbi:MAG TPA: hypothetical protein DGB85_06555 [Deltaproteobacteria bacterium]|nr:hypothetical protein [Deltaproteobacteria bacterium]|tara:strand:+ start:1323 stop:1742 length:420 start_codon:yes stop_codon:yes gene_type:complete
MQKLMALLGIWLFLLDSTEAQEIWMASNSVPNFSRQELIALVEGRTRQSFDSNAATLVVYLENQEVTRRFIEEFLELNYFRTLYQLREQINSGRASPLLDVPEKDDAYIAVFALEEAMTYSDDPIQQLAEVGLKMVEMR